MNFLFTHYIKKRFAERCKKEFSDMGFKRKKNSFVRVTNDVIQFFTLDISRGGYSCTINFESSPFCCGIPRGLGISGAFRIDWFDELRKSKDWEYNFFNKNSMDECVESMILSIKNHIIPFFKKALTPAAVFNESFYIEPTLNKEDRENLLKTKDYKKYCQINIFTDSFRYYLALKIKDYDYAKWYLETRLTRAEEAYEETKDYISEENRKKRESSIETLKNDLKMLELKEYNHFDEIIENKEHETKDFLRSIKL